MLGGEEEEGSFDWGGQEDHLGGWDTRRLKGNNELEAGTEGQRQPRPGHIPPACMPLSSSQSEAYMHPVFAAVLFTTAAIWKQPTLPIGR